MRGYLSGQYELDDIFKRLSWSELDRAALDDLRNFRLVMGHFDVSMLAALPVEMKTLTILREPLRRTLSAILHMKRDPNFGPIHSQVKDLSVFEILSDEKFSLYFKNNQTSFLSGEVKPELIISHLEYCKQEGITFDVNDVKTVSSIDEAKLTLERTDFVGTVENINQFSAFLAQEMQYHSNEIFRTDNARPADDQKLEALSGQELDLLKLHNDLDLELYEYAQKLEAQRLTKFQDLGVVDHVNSLVRSSTYQVQSGSFRIDPVLPIPGSGWFEAELNGSQQRWTGPGLAFTLELPLATGIEYRLFLRAYSPIEIFDQQIRTKLNGVSVDNLIETLSEKDFLLTLDFQVPITESSYSVCSLEFCLQKLFLATELGGDDIRTLGICVFDIRFEKLSS